MRTDRRLLAALGGILLVAAALVYFSPPPPSIVPSRGNVVPMCDIDLQAAKESPCPPDGSENDTPGVEPAGDNPVFPSTEASPSTLSTGTPLAVP